MSNTLPGSKKPKKTEDSDEDAQIYTSLLFELNLKAQDAVREFSLHDIDDKEGIELKRIAMHDAFTELYDTVASFSQEIMVGDFDMAYLRNRVAQSEGEMKEQLEAALEELEDQTQRNLADVWKARVMAWLHTAAAASGPFVENEHENIQQAASKYLAKVYTMLERPFTAVAKKVDGTQKLRRVALGLQAYNLMKESLEEDDAELTKAVLTGENPSGNFINFSATAGGNFKISLEEYESDTTPFRTNLEGGGKVAVGTTAVEVTFTGTTRNIIITADIDNSGYLYVGKSNVTSVGANAITFLMPGDSLTISYDDSDNALYVVGSEASQNFWKGALL